MPIRIGEDLVDAIYIGDERVDRVYLGNDLVYPDPAAATALVRAMSRDLPYDTISDAVGQQAGTSSPLGGLATDGTYVWAARAGRPVIRAFTLAPFARAAVRDVDTGATDLTGAIATDGDTMWAVRRTSGAATTAGVAAFDLMMGTRLPARDITAAALFAAGVGPHTTGLATDGTTLWVADAVGPVLAFRIATVEHDAGKDVAAATLNAATGRAVTTGIGHIATDGTTLWAALQSGATNPVDAVFAFGIGGGRLTGRERSAIGLLTDMGASAPAGLRGFAGAMMASGGHLWVVATAEALEVGRVAPLSQILAYSTG